jgi:hypothetical protein
MLEQNQQDQEEFYDVGCMNSKDDMVEANEEMWDELTTRVEEAEDSEEFQEALDVLCTVGEYSVRNKMLLQAQAKNRDGDYIGPFNGYNQWQNEFGRVPAEGESGFWILAPYTITYCKDSEERAKYCTHCDDRCEDTEKKVCGFNGVCTFAYSQTVEMDNKPEDTKDISLIDVAECVEKENVDNEYAQKCVNDIKDTFGSEINIHIITDPSNWDTVSNRGGDAIEKDDIKRGRVRGFDAENGETIHHADILSTLVHEIAHIKLGHSDRNISRPKREMEAEAVSYVVCKTLGIQTDYGQYVAQHMKHSEKEKSEMIKESLDRINNLSMEVLEAIKD